MIIFTDEQEKLIQEAINWYHNSSEQVFQYSGGPGTGKSVVMNEIIKRLKLKVSQVAPMCYVGAAAINLRLKGLSNAKTIHSWLYEPVEVPMIDEHGEPIMDTYLNRQKIEIRFVPKDLTGIELMAIDEGGTVPLNMREDILSRGKKILVAGDLDQLPPVADKSAFLYNGKVYKLTQIMRQAQNSPIVFLCQRAKNGYPIQNGLYGNDVYVISEDEVTDSMIYHSGVLLCGKNTTRDRLNSYRRNNILGYTTDLPNMGEKLICRKNNWLLEVGGINLTNGLTGTVVNQPDVSKFDGKSFYIDFAPDLMKSELGIFYDTAVDYEYFIANRETKNMIKSTQYRFKANLFEYGYSQTVHLAQGSQWNNGMYYEEYLHPNINNSLNYTALSRFKQKCIYVKPKRKYF